MVCELTRKAHDAGLSTLILARSAEQAEQLDDMLWDMGEDAYIPHQIAGMDEDEDEADVLIATPDSQAALRALVINLRDAAVADGFERVLEVVPADDSARGPLRERWKQYQARGLALNKHDM
ncbi:DNA polymerase III chi subunit, HolC family protein [Lysobacter capsici]|nr:DNA polymerase III chi subunit, HolC family protein [Lysobacter capsici]